ncbi:hypothetical protein GIB67_010318, partial [Kingdonia uniflora]
RICLRLGCSWGESVDSLTYIASDLVIGQATDYWILGRDSFTGDSSRSQSFPYRNIRGLW